MFTGRPKPIRITSVRISGVYCIKMYQHILIIYLGRSFDKYKRFVCFWRNSPQWARASSFTRFLDHTHSDAP